MNLADTISSDTHPRAALPAVMHADRASSYREFHDLVNSVAGRLAKLGVRPGDAVGICLQDRPIHLAAIFSVLRLGGIVLSMDWRWTLAEQKKIALRFSPRVVLVEPNRPCPADVPVVPVDESWETMDANSPVTSTFDGTDAPAILSLSSGTTGEPKAIVTTHSQYRARLDSFSRAGGMTREDRYYSVLPLSFSAGRLFAMANLVNGATVMLAGSMASPREIVEGINQSGATTTCLVPSVSRAILKMKSGGPAEPGNPLAAGEENRDGDGFLLPNLRTVLSVGAPLHHHDRLAIREHLCPNLIDMYASSGGSLATAITPAEQDRYPDSVGRPAENVEMQVVDDADRPLPAGAIGRVRYRGPGFPLGFYKDSEAHEDLRDGWCYPGDFASINAEGYVFLHGRKSEIVIRGGINVFTPEIEKALLAHPAVIEAAAVGVASADAGEDVVAFVRIRTSITSRELLAHCRTLLAPYKIPTRIHLVESLPRNSAGKVLKGELVKLDVQLR